MAVHAKGAQRASRRFASFPALIGALAAVFILGGGVVEAAPAHHAAQKVVIVVGPTDGLTAEYKHIAQGIAR